MRRLAGALALALLCTAPALAQSSMSGGAMGTMPSCRTGDPVVWLNTSTKVYHAQGDAYYGKTRHGKYVCQSDATAMGAHASGSHHSTTSSSSMNGMSGMKPGCHPESGMSSSSTSSTSHHHHRHHRTSGATATPSPTSTM